MVNHDSLHSLIIDVRSKKNVAFIYQYSSLRVIVYAK